MTLRDLVPSFGKKKVPVRHDDENPFNMLHREMDRVVDDFFRGFEMESFDDLRGAFSPKIEVRDDEKEIRVSAELPGMEEKDIDITLSDNILTLSGEKKEEKESDGKDCYVRERSYGSFRRSIPLYTEIDEGNVDARFRKGVLTITIPKTKKAMEQKKKIAVHTD